jgi:uncharacterized protein DUF4339
MAYGIEDRESLLLAAEQPERLSAYGDEDDVVTQVIDAAHAEPKWIVQITPLDRRMMSTAELLSASNCGVPVREDTLVWRGGMEDWLPLDQVDALASVRRQLPTLAPQKPAPRRRSPRAKPWAVAAVDRVVSNGLLVPVAIVLSTAALTISALAVCGAFDSGPAAEERGTSVSASSR